MVVFSPSGQTCNPPQQPTTNLFRSNIDFVWGSVGESSGQVETDPKHCPVTGDSCPLLRHSKFRLPNVLDMAGRFCPEIRRTSFEQSSQPSFR